MEIIESERLFPEFRVAFTIFYMQLSMKDILSSGSCSGGGDVAWRMLISELFDGSFHEITVGGARQ